MTRAALRPIPPRPEPTPAQDGYAVHTPDRLFLCELDHATHGYSIPARLGYTRHSGRVKVWSTEYAARLVADRITGAVVSSVPRRLGESEAWVWERVER